MLLKNASDLSVLVLPVALIRNGANPAAVIISSGTVEQKYPNILPPWFFQFCSTGLSSVLVASSNCLNALDFIFVSNGYTPFLETVLMVVFFGLCVSPPSL
jgi:hypothetical protein